MKIRYIFVFVFVLLLLSLQACGPLDALYDGSLSFSEWTIGLLKLSYEGVSEFAAKINVLKGDDIFSQFYQKYKDTSDFIFYFIMTFLAFYRGAGTIFKDKKDYNPRVALSLVLSLAATLGLLAAKLDPIVLMFMVFLPGLLLFLIVLAFKKQGRTTVAILLILSSLLVFSYCMVNLDYKSPPAVDSSSSTSGTVISAPSGPDVTVPIAPTSEKEEATKTEEAQLRGKIKTAYGDCGLDKKTIEILNRALSNSLNVEALNLIKKTVKDKTCEKVVNKLLEEYKTKFIDKKSAEEKKKPDDKGVIPPASASGLFTGKNGLILLAFILIPIFVFRTRKVRLWRGNRKHKRIIKRLESEIKFHLKGYYELLMLKYHHLQRLNTSTRSHERVKAEIKRLNYLAEIVSGGEFTEILPFFKSRRLGRAKGGLYGEETLSRFLPSVTFNRYKRLVKLYKTDIGGEHAVEEMIALYRGFWKNQLKDTAINGEVILRKTILEYLESDKGGKAVEASKKIITELNKKIIDKSDNFLSLPKDKVKEIVYILRDDQLKKRFNEIPEEPTLLSQHMLMDLFVPDIKTPEALNMKYESITKNQLESLYDHTIMLLVGSAYYENFLLGEPNYTDSNTKTKDLKILGFLLRSGKEIYDEIGKYKVETFLSYFDEKFYGEEGKKEIVSLMEKGFEGMLNELYKSWNGLVKEKDDDYESIVEFLLDKNKKNYGHSITDEDYQKFMLSFVEYIIPKDLTESFTSVEWAHLKDRIDEALRLSRWGISDILNFSDPTVKNAFLTRYFEKICEKIISDELNENTLAKIFVLHSKIKPSYLIMELLKDKDMYTKLLTKRGYVLKNLKGTFFSKFISVIVEPALKSERFNWNSFLAFYHMNEKEDVQALLTGLVKVKDEFKQLNDKTKSALAELVIQHYPPKNSKLIEIAGEHEKIKKAYDDIITNINNAKDKPWDSLTNLKIDYKDVGKAVLIHLLNAYFVKIGKDKQKYLGTFYVYANEFFKLHKVVPTPNFSELIKKIKKFISIDEDLEDGESVEEVEIPTEDVIFSS